MKGALKEYLRETGVLLEEQRKLDPPFPYETAELMEGTYAYFLRGGKRLRPAICRMAAGALGGEAAERAALPCALGLEYYHNWTLIHDDVLDHDDLRRGKPAVHTLTTDRFREESGADAAGEYGLDLAILAGDALHSAAIRAIAGAKDVSPEVTLAILRLLEGEYGPRLIEGETVDTKNGVLYGKGRFAGISRDTALGVIRGKTGALFAIAAGSGGMIGQSRAEETPEIRALFDFAEACGIAFQLQDDILGLTSTDGTLGKPVCSDIREGKPTVLLLTSFANATEEERAFLLETVGRRAGDEQVEKARRILLARGGVEESRRLADESIRKANGCLAVLAPSRWRDLLEAWRDAMVDRDH
ncbi:MAG: polyprenyl synthetase family protein [Clostridia bacterium]|nr:polyprenyl synthetase family protein [Clostridia bacterium]